MDNYLTIKSNKFLIHLAGWLCFLFYPFLLGVPFREDILIKLFFQTSLLATFFYINSAVFVPHFLIKGRIASYIGSVLLVIGIIVAANYFFNHLFELDRTLAEAPKPNPADLKKVAKHANHALRRIVRPVFSSLFILAASTSYVLLMDWFKNERKKKEIENENLMSELSFLKSQVSPHFLFNTLNNIYSLSLSNSDMTSNAIMKLSLLLRYMLYEADAKQVSLDKEIEYINNYIELQRMRIREGVIISFVTQGDFASKLIEPMLLIPFIENAFKHGINYSKTSDIKIEITLLGNELLLKVENSINNNSRQPEASGIGLSNVKRRLSLLYPDLHTLDIEETNGIYKVTLKIALNK
jgi:two-component system LytT family sensor kinase